MREAEASLSLKEMRQRLADMEQQWLKYMQSRAAPSYFQSYHNSEDASIEASSSNHVLFSAPMSPTNAAPSTSSTETFNGSVLVDADSNSLSGSSQQHSPRAFAKFTATLIGAAGTITGSHGSIGGTSVEESESGLSIRDLEDQLWALK